MDEQDVRRRSEPVVQLSRKSVETVILSIPPVIISLGVHRFTDYCAAPIAKPNVRMETFRLGDLQTEPLLLETTGLSSAPQPNLTSISNSELPTTTGPRDSLCPASGFLSFSVADPIPEEIRKPCQIHDMSTELFCYSLSICNSCYREVRKARRNLFTTHNLEAESDLLNPEPSSNLSIAIEEVNFRTDGALIV